MRVLLTQPKGKDNLCNAFIRAGAQLTTELTPEVKLIIPLVDEELWFFSRSREWFKQQGIIVACSSEYAVSICRDKAEFYRFLRRHGFGTPVTSQFEGLVKPRFGKGSRGQFRIDRSYIVQELINAPEYSIDYFKDPDSGFLSITPRLRENVVNGESQAGTIVKDELLIKEATRLGQELGLEYHNVMQCFYDGKRILWLEVNCRYGGGSWISFGVFNSPDYLVKKLQEKV